MLGIKMKLSTSFHLQTDRMNESNTKTTFTVFY